MNRILVTPPGVEPVTLDELKEHARVDTDAEDDLLTFLIVAAREWCESYTRIAFIEQSWKLSYDRCDLTSIRRELDLKHGAILEIEAITSYDTSDEATVMDEDDYRISNQRIVFAENVITPYSWREFDGLEIEYTVGFGDAAENIPHKIKQSIKMLAAYWYESREAIGDMMGKGKEDMVPFSVQSLLMPHKRFIV